MKKKMLTALLVLVFSLTLAMPTPALSQSDYPFHVKPTPVGNADGSDWDNACSLQYALTNASSGDEIWVADGTYKPHATNWEVSFQLDSGEKVYGGFDGTETSREERDWETNETILSGDIDAIWDSYHVVMVQGMNEAVLDGFTITGGYAPLSGTSSPHSRGGGIYNTGKLTVNNCTIEGNSASQRGGGIYNTGTLTVNNCTIEENGASGRGGGVYNDEGTLTVINSIISHNTAYWAGGGIYNTGTLTVNDSTISYNGGYQAPQPHHGGGGIYNNGELTVNNCTFSNNSAKMGGGVYNTGGTLIVNSSSIYENTAYFRGGGLSNVEGSATLNWSIISQNTTTGTAGSTYTGGGGIALDGPGTLTVINSIINGNTADAEDSRSGDGGGIRVGGPQTAVNIINSTIVDNTCESYDPDAYPPIGGGGIRGGPTTIINSILWGNKAGDQSNQFLGSPTVTYSLIQGGYPAGKKVISDDPSFVGPSIGDFHLTLDSPAIDAGKNSAVPKGVTVDLDGNPRIVNRTVDMGAFEYLTAQQADTLDLIKLVGELVDSEVLNPGQGNALIVKLEAAFDQMYRNDNTAINQLEAFINQVEGILSQEKGELLIDAANDIIEQL